MFDPTRRHLLRGAAALSALAIPPGLSRSAGQIAAAPGSLPRLPIGMNLAGVSDYEPGFPFRNLMWGARPWLTRNTSCCGPWDTEAIKDFKLDKDGYPLEAPLKIDRFASAQEPFTLLPNTRRPGQYILLHDGVGEIAGILGTKVLSAAPGRVVLQMTHDPSAVEGFAIRKSVRGNHLRNIRVLPLADEKADLGANPFITEFLDFCRPFHALRFMDWAVTNGSLEQEWAGRKRPSFYTMVGVSGDPDGTWGVKPTAFDHLFSGGVAIEIILQLANQLGIDPWLCVPHRATDEYMSEYAKLIGAQLDDRRHFYLEYSNEIWNWTFVQANWMMRSRLAGDLVEAKGGAAWEDAAKTKGTGHPERIGALSRRAFALFEREWRERDRSRLVRVCAVQQAWIDASRRTAAWCAANGGADVLSPAGYFGPSDAQFDRWERKGARLTADEIIADMREIVGGQCAQLTAQQAAIAQEFGLELAIYEGGQHLQTRNQEDAPYNAALGAAQSHAGMYDLYMDNLRHHQAAKCRLFTAFTSISPQGSRYGSWGAKASYDQPLAQAPKMRALLDANEPYRPRAI